MSAYNEADIIHESISKLIQQGIHVYLIDNGSTDHTLEIASQFLGNGLIQIENCVFTENGKEVYDWTALLRRKEQLAQQLDFDWFMHVDADEIRYSPWLHLNLCEGIEVVDKQGFNLINFRLFNFRLTHEKEMSQSYEEALTYYSSVEKFNRMQVKAWKKNKNIDIVTHAGHLAILPSPKIYPIRFIHKHYPVRSIEQGYRKIIKERLARYSATDRRKGWHVQYDHLSTDYDNIRNELIWDAQKLEKFNANKILAELFLDASKLLAHYVSGSKIERFQININNINNLLPQAHLIADEVKIELIETINYLINKIKNKQVVNINNINDAKDVGKIIYQLIDCVAISEYMRGDPELFENLKTIELEEKKWQH